jgi:hypothetical protein
VPEAKKAAELAAAQTDVIQLVRRAERGDEAAMPVLRNALDSDGVLVEAAGNLASQVEATLIRNAAGKNLLFKEATERKMARLRREVAGADPTPLEHLLADRVALCWLALHDAEIRFAQSRDLTIKQADFWQKRIDCAHRRYLSAIKTLATVRKLALPALQVNIARKQVNVLNPGAEGNTGPALVGRHRGPSAT